MSRCKALEVPRNEAYDDVRRNDEGREQSRAVRDRWAFFSSLLGNLCPLHIKEDRTIVVHNHLFADDTFADIGL
jgi:hypothetical protein